MALKIQSTKVTETPKGFSVEMILSSSPDVETAPDVVQLRATLDTSDRYPRLAELQKAALQHARAAIKTEIDRLQAAQGRTP